MLNLHTKCPDLSYTPKLFSPHVVDKELTAMIFFHEMQFYVEEKYYEKEQKYIQYSNKTKALLEYVEEVSVLIFKDLCKRSSSPLISYMKPLVNNFFREVQQLPRLAPLEPIVFKIHSLILNKQKEILDPFLMNVVHLQFNIPANELKLLEGEGQYKAKKISISCEGYAFYKVLEKRMVPYILNKTTSFPLGNYIRSEDIIHDLCNWNYQVVQDPQKGDLIVYLDDVKVKHFGVLESSERVLSKWGELPVFSHPIESVSTKYGDRYLLFRKGRGDGLETDVIELLETVENSLATFSHPVCYSPLSINGCKSTLRDRVIILMDSYEKQAVDKPPYGISYFKNLRSFFKEKLDTSTDTNCRREIPQLFKNVISEAFDTVDGMQ